MRRHMQIVFQDSVGSLDPRMKVGDLIAEGLTIHGIGARKERDAVVHEMLERVGMPPEAADRYPHQFSGGQRQRIGLARALVLQPKLVVADEPVSALDVSIQSQVLNLLVELKARVRPHLRLRRPRSRRRRLHLRPRRRDVPRPDRRDRPVGRALPPAAAPLHDGVALGEPRARPGPQEQRASSSPATSRAPSTHPRAAASARAARSPSRSAPRSTRRSRITASTTGRRATSPARRSRTPHAPPA